MNMTRRETLVLASAATAGALIPNLTWAADAEATVSAFTGGAELAESGVELTAPEIAENGNTVPVAVSAAGAVSILLVATANPEPNVFTVNFGPKSGSPSLSTRIRLAKTQDVIAIAKLADGSFAKASKLIKVTIGGCGG